jgi:hypothetical protein
MDWVAVGKLIAPLAPVAGSILGGLIPVPGGSVIGQKFGEAIARAFGVDPTPKAVSDAVAAAGEETARAKINAALEQCRAEISGFVELERLHTQAVIASLTQTNETMRVEVRPENRHWFYTGWRPTAGWLFNLFATVFGVLLAWASVVAILGNAKPLDVLHNAWPLYAAFLGALALIVGVYMSGRSFEKGKAIEQGAPVVIKPPVIIPEVKPPPATKPAAPPARPPGKTHDAVN